MGSVGERLVREAVLEGLFYPHRRHDLREAISNLLLRSEEPAGHARGIVCPHASLQYAGLHEATAFKAAAARDIQLIVILASATHHTKRTPAVPESQAFRTPLGDSIIDQEFIRDLTTRLPTLRKDDLPFLESPAVETPLPFIQYLWPESRIVPCIIPNLKTADAAILTAELLKTQRRYDSDRVLWIASTNIARGGNANHTRRHADRILKLLRVRGAVHETAAAPISGHNAGYPAETVCTLLKSCVGSRTSCEVLTRGSSCDFDGNSESNTEYAAIAFFAESEIRDTP
ncbi:MAG: AmmeMemoRadiSam system protein B [Spirochaetota bacterium]